MTWITPFDWMTSATVTVATPPASSVTVTLSPSTWRVSLQPPTVSTTCWPPSAGTRQRLDEAGGLDGGNERGVVGRVHGVFDDVLGLEHRRTADHRVFGQSVAGRESGDGENGANGSSAEKIEFHGMTSFLWDRYVPVETSGVTEGRPSQFRKFRSQRIMFRAQIRHQPPAVEARFACGHSAPGRQGSIGHDRRAPFLAGPLRGRVVRTQQ